MSKVTPTAAPTFRPRTFYGIAICYKKKWHLNPDCMANLVAETSTVETIHHRRLYAIERQIPPAERCARCWCLPQRKPGATRSKP